MSLEVALARVTEIQRMASPHPANAAGRTGGAAAPGAAAPGAVTSSAAAMSTSALIAPAPAVSTAPTGTFATALSNATAVGGAQASSTGEAVLAAARGELERGVAEQPPGSNDSPRIAEYRAAMPNNPGVGPWCAYFVSWCAKQAGVPLGPGGSGFAAVDSAAAWARSAGRWSDAAGYRPQPGDLIVFDEHIGVVERVNADGTVATVEGNSSNRVSARTRQPGEPLGYIRMS